MQPIVIKPVIPEMLDTLVQLEQQTFMETFGPTHQPDDLAVFMQERKDAAALREQLLQPGCLYYLLYYGEHVAGFLKLNLGKQPDDASHTQLPSPVELEKIYVLKAWQGHKLGKALIQHAYTVAREHQAATIWLGVWEHNTKALRFYGSEGFEKFGEHTFKVGQQSDTDWLLKRAVK